MVEKEETASDYVYETVLKAFEEAIMKKAMATKATKYRYLPLKSSNLWLFNSIISHAFSSMPASLARNSREKHLLKRGNRNGVIKLVIRA
jgi:hypothetical protein